MKLFWRLILILGIILAVGGYLAERETRLSPDLSQVDIQQCERGTPREAIASFLRSMHRYEEDNQFGFSCLVPLVASPEEIKEEIDKSVILLRARQLLLLLENLDFQMEDIVSDRIDVDKVTLPFTYQNKSVDITMLRADTGWFFDPSMFKSAEFRSTYQTLQDTFERFTRSDMQGDTFVPDLMSPYRTLYTLRAGVEGLDAEGMTDALKTMDMSEFLPPERSVYGPVLAVMLYRIITLHSTLQLEELSADPTTTRQPIFLVVPGLGTVTMHVVTQENGVKAWKFTPKSLEVAWKSYDDIMRNLMVQGVDPFIGVRLSLHTRLDDLVQKHARGLLVYFLKSNLYKWIIIFVLLVATPLLCRVSSWLANRILTTVESRLPSGVSGYKHFVLPAQILLVAFVWLKTILILFPYRGLMVATLYSLEIMMIGTMVWVVLLGVGVLTEILTAGRSASIRGTMLLIIGQIVKILAILAGLVAIANLFNQNSTRIVAALGIGGIALALAGKDTLENIFGTLVIMTTRPFAVGDWILVDQVEGTVEKVGVRSTSIRTFYNSEVTVPNAKFITSPVDNMGRRTWRRYKTFIGVAYDTPIENVNEFVQGLRQIVLDRPTMNKENFHIVVNDFGPWSLNIMVYVFFKTADWAEELKERHRFIMDTLALAETMGISITVPESIVHLRQDEASAQAERTGPSMGTAKISSD
ncbi:mechanosensitive ion channel family protein [Oceanidesulfovibrio marinus]|uniref:Mechanosensitive ion channel family protein n=1 Tax=Oceanidesulfovibrio marinus TaxID=370038 RepID=A0ABX6NMJ6_9BACT|nr:mechanosensitive ion channel family protein [Oceanidesulfovibrio marinus]QJT10932.1 mechanosensitive ion channel family protein [Oceanidesulfovibrio marinus]